MYENEDDKVLAKNLTVEESFRIRRMKDNMQEMSREQLYELCEHLMLHVCYRDGMMRELYKEKLGISDIAKTDKKAG